MSATIQSYFHRASTIPLLNDTLGGALDKAAERWPDQEAVVVRDQGARLTFADSVSEVDRLAAGLIALGLKPGDRVGLWSPNRIEWVLTQYATAKAGLILVNINPGYRAGELEYALNKVECRALITADRFKTTDYIGILRELAPELEHCAPGALRAARLPHLTIAVHFADTDEPGYFRFGDILALGGPAERARLDELSGLLQPDDPINIQFTSGTTGSPKAATLTHHGLLNNGYFCGRMLGIEAGERLGQPFPLYHVGGMVCGSILGVTLGATIIYLGESFDPVASLETIQAERCSHFCGVPTMLIAILNHPAFRQFDLSSLRGGFSGGSPVPSDVARRVMDDMNMRDFICIYGMTELSGSSVQNTPEDSFEQRVATIGRVQPHMEVKIADIEGRTVPIGTQGELCFRGFMVMRGYWNDDARTQRNDRRGAVAAFGRSGRHGRGRLHQDHRPQQGHGDPWRREHLPARGRGIPVQTSRRGRCAGVWRARRSLGRGTLRLDQTEIPALPPPRRIFGLSAAVRSRISKFPAMCGLWMNIQ